MSERELQLTLDETTDFLTRQRLLRQLWKFRQQREAETAASVTHEPPADPTEYLASRQPESTIA